MEFNTAIAMAAHREALSFEQMRHLADEELMICLQAGYGDALAVLFSRYERLVLSVAFKIVRDPGEAEDVTQTVFLDIYRAAAQFDPKKGTTKVWLLQYAYHRAIHRKQHLELRNFYDAAELQEVSDRLDCGWSPLLNASETKILVRQGLAVLSNAQKTVIELALFQGLSLREIAEKMGESLVNVRHHYYRGLGKVRSFLSAGKDEEFDVGQRGKHHD